MLGAAGLIAIAYAGYRFRRRLGARHVEAESCFPLNVRAAHAIMEQRKSLTAAFLPTSAVTGPERQKALAAAFGGEDVVELLRQLASHWESVIETKRQTKFDDGNPHHVGLLRRLWDVAFVPARPFERESDRWTELGFQGRDPGTDLRAGGIFCLEQFVLFAERDPVMLRDMMQYNREVLQSGEPHWFLTAVVSIQLSTLLALQKTFMLFEGHLRLLCRRDAAMLERVVKANERANHYAGGSGGAAAAVPERSGLVLTEVTVGELHYLLFQHFFTQWRAKKPHIMEYNTWVVPSVYKTFFSKEWSS